MNKITQQDLLDIGLQDTGYNDLLTLANNINLLLESNDLKMILDEVVDFVKHSSPTIQSKYEELQGDYEILSEQYDDLETQFEVLQKDYSKLQNSINK